MHIVVDGVIWRYAKGYPGATSPPGVFAGSFFATSNCTGPRYVTVLEENNFAFRVANYDSNGVVPPVEIYVEKNTTPTPTITTRSNYVLTNPNNVPTWVCQADADVTPVSARPLSALTKVTAPVIPGPIHLAP